MAPSFVGQDLRNRSFRGRKDLAGADFTGADLRGCDFRAAILIGANFTKAKTGKSRKQLITLIAFAFLGTTAVVVAGVSVGMVADAGVFAFAFTGAIAFAFAFAFLGAGVVAGMFTFSFVLVFASAAIGHTYIIFADGKIALGIVNGIVSLFLLFLAWYCLQQLVKTIKSAIGSDFRGADLSGAKFVNAHLEVTDFTNAKCDLINWQGAEFYLCKLPKNIEDNKIGYLCRNPDKGRGENYTSLDFRNTYLQNVDLVDAILRNANFNGADLRGAKLTNANLSNLQALGTDFSGATLTGSCIDNWGINSNTKFDDIVCDYIFLSQKIDENGDLVYDPESRKPANGNFQQGDFAKLMRQYQDGLDLIFRNGDDPKTFAFALQKLMDEYEEAQLQFGGLQNLGDGDIVLRLTVGNSQVPKSKLHSFFTETKKIAQSFFSQGLNQNSQKLESEIKQLKKELADKDRQLESSLVRTKHSPSDNAKVGNNFSLISVIVQDSMFGKKTDIKAGGDVSGVADGNISGVAGKDLKGVAGRDISGQVTITIQQLRDSNTPEAPKLADLLTELQQAINESTELVEKDKTQALKYLDKIGQLANDKEADRDMISMAIDGILNVVSKAAKLLTPVQAIADGLRKILQL